MSIKDIGSIYYDEKTARWKDNFKVKKIKVKNN